MTILFDGRPEGYVFDGVNKYTNGVTSKSLLLKQEIADGDRPSAYEIVKDPTGIFDRVVWKMTAEYPRDYLSSTNKVRCELQPSPVNGGYGTVLEERWYWSAFMLPPNFKFTKNASTGIQNTLILFELHDYPNPPRIQPWSMLLVNDKIELWRAIEESGSLASYYTKRLQLGGSVQTGVWYCFVVRAIWDGDTAAGEMDIWVNNRKIHSESSMNNTFSGTEDIYPKNGMYVSHGWPTDWPSSQAGYWTGFIVADGTSNTYNQFMQECGYSFTELEKTSGPKGAF